MHFREIRDNKFIFPRMSVYESYAMNEKHRQKSLTVFKGDDICMITHTVRYTVESKV